MGIIIGKVWRKKTTLEQLETLDKEIKTIEEYRKNTEQTHKRIVGRFIVISVAVYLLTAFLFYFYYFPATFYDRLFYIIPLILAPVIILTVKRVLTWYYKWKISRKQNKLSTLKDEKKKMLEKVMETETYKVAKTILEKFAPEPARKAAPVLSPMEFSTPQRPPGTPAVVNTAMTGGLRQRALPAPSQPAFPFTTPARTLAITNKAASTVVKPEFPVVQRFQSAVVGSPLPMPRAILPRERSVFDKMVDYLIGDGPTNRFALICRNCYSHNGMAFREEFEYISFRCCYCFTFNPARKKRPAAPKLEFELKSLQARSSSDTSESEKQSPSESESETETLPLIDTQLRHLADVPKETENREVLLDKLEEFVPMDVDQSPTKVDEAVEQLQPVDKATESFQPVDDPKISDEEHTETIEEKCGTSDDIIKD